jgi:Ger(x)C family germination protein
MMDVINLPGAFIERQEALMFGFWIVTAFALGNAMLFFSGLLIRDTIKKVSLAKGVAISAVAVFGVSILPLHRETVYAHMDFLYMTTGIFFLLILPLALLIAAKITRWGRKAAILATLAVLAAIIFAGCWDSKEIENRAFVVAMGVDHNEDGYAVTLSIPIITDSADDEIPAHIKTAEGKTITEALKKLDAKNDKSLYYGQTKLVVLGTGILENEQYLSEAVNTLKNKLEAPRRIHVLAADEPQEILSAKPPGEIMPGSYVSDIYRDKEKIGGRSFVLDFERLSNATEAIIPKIHNTDDELRLAGAVVLPHMKDLTPKELQGLLWSFQNGNRGAVVTAQNLSLKVEKHKTNLYFQEAAPLRIIMEVTVTGRVDELPEIAQESQETRNKTQQLFTQKITQEILATAEILQNELAVDGYNFLETLRKKNYPLYKVHADNWEEIFPKIEIVPLVNVSLT